jgi:hypothetical protein
MTLVGGTLVRSEIRGKLFVCVMPAKAGIQSEA